MNWAAIDPDQSWERPSWVLRCPTCGCDYTRYSHVEAIVVDETSGLSTRATPGTADATRFKSRVPWRGDWVSIWVQGECGHGWYLYIAQHKGQTFLFTSENESPLLKDMPYADYLKTKHWQQVRHNAIERAGGRCQVCNSTDRLNVHHNTYERRGEELPSDVIVLCQRCHETFHQPVNGRPTRTVQ